MINPSRAVSVAALAGVLVCTLGLGAGRQAGAAAPRVTEYAGIAACLRSFHYSFTFNQETDTLDEEGQTVYTLIPGAMIQADTTYWRRFTKYSTNAVTDEEDTTVQIVQGSLDGPTGQLDAYRGGYELGVAADLALGMTRVPATETVEQTRTLKGRVVSDQRTTSEIEEDHPENGAPPPLLTLRADKTQLTGSRTKNLPGPNSTDTSSEQIDGHAGCIWLLVVVLYNGEPLNPAAPTGGGPQKLLCSPVPQPSAAPPPPPEVGNAASTARRDDNASYSTSQGSQRISWRKLQWSDYHAMAPPPSSTLAMTYSGLGTNPGFTTLPLCDPATHSYTYTATFTLGNKDAFFDPGMSWGRSELTTQPTSALAKNVLNHEQRHFDISEVYSKLAYTELKDTVLGGKLVHTFTCSMPAACIVEITALFQQLQQSLQTYVSRKDATQELYDQAAGRVDLTGPQAKWNTMIDGWLEKPSTAL